MLVMDAFEKFFVFPRFIYAKGFIFPFLEKCLNSKIGGGYTFLDVYPLRVAEFPDNDTFSSVFFVCCCCCLYFRKMETAKLFGHSS